MWLKRPRGWLLALLFAIELGVCWILLEAVSVMIVKENSMCA